MATDTYLADPATLTPVNDPADETTGRRIARLREELGWRQVDLAAASGVQVSTISNVERDMPAKRGERPSAARLEETMEQERARRTSENPQQTEERQRVLLDLLFSEGRSVRMDYVGRNQKTRYITFALPAPDATLEQVLQDLEDFHREQRKNDPPKG
jgi:transcriptional regulator with XRE-family HTH domain